MKTWPTYLLFLFFFLSSCQSDKQPVKSKKPNILFILVDDLGVNDLSFTGSTYYETPNIDGIAREGVSFTQGYAASRVCSPSRASIMTGKFTARHGITDWIGAKSGEAWRDHGRHDKMLPANYQWSLPLEENTMAEVMAKAGYRTFFAGKWHLGEEGSYPEDHGFSINVGGWEKGSPMGGYFSPWNNPKLKNVTDGENLTLRLAKETAEFIQVNKDSSFFAFLSFYAVHGPIQTNQQLWSKYRDKATSKEIADKGFKMEEVLPIRQLQDNPVYAGLVETTDTAVGLVLEALKANGIEENTIVIFTSDNGGVSSGDAFSTSNLPYKGGKGYQWEGGIRVPYFMKIPWLEEQNITVDYPVSGSDFFPTILDLAGIDLNPTQHMDGISLKPLLVGESLDERPLYWHYPHYGNQGGAPSSIIRLGNWKLIHFWEDDHHELFNLEADPFEAEDVAAQNEALTDSLSFKLKHWLNDVGANYASFDSAFNQKLANQRREDIVNTLWPRLERQRKTMLSPDFSPNKNWWGSKVTID